MSEPAVSIAGSEPMEGDMLSAIESICLGCLERLQNPPVYPCFVNNGRTCCHICHISNRSCAAVPECFHKTSQSLINEFHEMLLSDEVLNERFAMYQTAVARFVLDVQVYKNAGGVLEFYMNSDDLLSQQGVAFDHSSVPESVFSHPAITSVSFSLGQDLGTLFELTDNVGEDEEADSSVEVLERNTAAYCCHCIRHLTTSPHHHCEPAEG
ncbi:repeat set, removed [Histoplasma ohiense]|nr:repeat set, removed [Histoplasma ohiense (nom. inval.)]